MKSNKILTDHPRATGIALFVLWTTGFILIYKVSGWTAVAGLFFLFWANNLQMASRKEKP